MGDKPIHEIVVELGESVPDSEWAKICEHGGLKRKCEICERDDEIAELRARLSALEEEIARLSEMRDSFAMRLNFYCVRAAAWKRCALKYRDVVWFYSDPSTYFAIMFVPDPPCGDLMDDFSNVDHLGYGIHGDKPGKRAREALRMDAAAYLRGKIELETPSDTPPPGEKEE